MTKMTKFNEFDFDDVPHQHPDHSLLTLGAIIGMCVICICMYALGKSDGRLDGFLECRQAQYPTTTESVGGDTTNNSWDDDIIDNHDNTDSHGGDVITPDNTL